MTIEFITEPYKRVGEYNFGMTRNSIKDSLGEPLSMMNYGYPISDRYLDDYGFLYMLSNNKCILEAVQIFPENTDDIVILLYGDIKITLN